MSRPAGPRARLKAKSLAAPDFTEGAFSETSLPLSSKVAVIAAWRLGPAMVTSALCSALPGLKLRSACAEAGKPIGLLMPTRSSESVEGVRSSARSPATSCPRLPVSVPVTPMGPLQIVDGVKAERVAAGLVEQPLDADKPW